MNPEVAVHLDAALALAAQGFLIGQCYGVGPDGTCDWPNPDCDSPGKHGGMGLMEQATRDPDVIRTRFMSGAATRALP